MKKQGICLYLIALLLIGCSQKAKAPAVYVSVEGKSIKFSGLDYAIISDINRDSVPGIWETLLPVYKMPADTDLKNYQPVQHGTYILKDSAVVFTPDTPFIKNQRYFMRYYQFGNGITAADLFTGKKQLGRVPYRDFDWWFIG